VRISDYDGLEIRERCEMSEEMRKIYEVVDSTDEEMYFLLGIFNTKEEINIDENASEQITEHGGMSGYETIQIRERRYGWSGDDYVVIREIKREQVIDEDSDELVWRVAKAI